MMEFLSPGILLSCDTPGCDGEFEHDGWIEWEEFLADAKADGWVSQRIGGEWKHWCPDCADKFRAGR
jgi:hypothetical protein